MGSGHKEFSLPYLLCDLIQQASSEQAWVHRAAPCNPALPSSAVISSLTLDKSFKTPSAFRVLNPHVPCVKGMPTIQLAMGGHLCHAGLLLVAYFHHQQVEIWRMELNENSSAKKWVVDQVSWLGSRFRTSFNSKKYVKLHWEEISRIFFFQDMIYIAASIIHRVRPSRLWGNMWHKGHSETYCMWLLWGIF